MNILIAADLYYPLVNGCSYFAQRLAFQLQTLGHRVIVIAPSETYHHSAREINGVKVFGIRSFPLFLYPKFRMCLLPFYSRAIEKIINDFKPDVIHFQHHFPVNRAVLKVAKKKGIPTVATNHFMPETMFHYLPFYSFLGQVMLKLAWMDFARVYRKMDKITTPTHTAARLISTYFTQPVTPISCGIDLHRFKPGQDTQVLRERYRIPKKPVLLYVGRLDKEKNLDLVIQAAAVAMKFVDFQLVIAGKGARLQSLEILVAKLQIAKETTFMGFVPDEDLPRLYCLADCFVIAGTAELQSIVTMEAMASALPILAVDAVALPELVIHGENGFLFHAEDEASLTEKIVTLFKEGGMRKKMGQKSLELITPHDIKTVLPQFEALYIDVVQGVF